MSLILYKILSSLYCLKCKKYIESINQKVSKTSNGRIIFL